MRRAGGRDVECIRMYVYSMHATEGLNDATKGLIPMTMHVDGCCHVGIALGCMHATEGLYDATKGLTPMTTTMTVGRDIGPRAEIRGMRARGCHGGT